MSTLLALQIQISLAVLLALLLRCCMTGLPKRWSYGLWLIVFLRLLLPISMESPLGILPGEEALESIGQQGADRETDDFVHDRSESKREPGELPDEKQGSLIGLNGVLPGVLGFLVKTEDSHAWQYRHSWQSAGLFLIWLAGVAGVLGHNLFVMCRIRRKIRDAEPMEEGVYLCPGLETPFTIGLLRPRIYLPTGLEPKETGYILCHERVHIRRRDYLVKGIAFLLVAFYWYNPLIWVAFGMLEQDMEMSCDEAVIRRMGNEIRRAYSQSLLDFATGRGKRIAVPLAFGEKGVKQRVKNILKGKNGGKRGTLAGVLILAVAAALVFMIGVRKEGAYESQTGSFRAEKAQSEEELAGLSELARQDTEEELAGLSELTRQNTEEELARLLELARQDTEEYRHVTEEIDRLALDREEETQSEEKQALLSELLRQDVEEYRHMAVEMERLASDRGDGAQLEEEIFRRVLEEMEQ